MGLNLRTMDDQRDALAAKHPGWQIWYVPSVHGTTWCARPLPSVSEASPEDLEKAIGEAEEDWLQEGVRRG